jgi:UDP-glucose 4-epimerase
MATTVVEAAGQGEVKMVDWPAGYDHFETGDFYASIKKIEAAIDWRPRLDLRSGITKTIEYYREHRDQYWSRPTTS